MKLLILVIILLFFSCNNNNNKLPIDYRVHIDNFKLEHFSKGIKNWDMTCKKSVIDEKKSIIICYNTTINLFSDSKITTIIKGFKGFGNMNDNNYYIEKDITVVSFKENTKIYTQKLYLDSKRELIYSKSPTKIIKENEGVEIESIGFEAKTDLSNIKIFKHTTKKI